MQRNKDAEVSDPLSPKAVVRISSRLLVKFNSIKNIPGTLTGFWGTLNIICEESENTNFLESEDFYKYDSEEWKPDENL